MSDVHALAGAYALDAVEPSERARFEEHVQHCDACREDVASFAETAALLTTLVATTPPASLRARLLDAAATVRPLPPLRPETPRIDGPEPDPGPAAPVPLAGRRPREHRGSHRTSRRPATLVAAAAVLVALAGGIAVGAWQPWHDEPTSTQAQPDVAEQVLRAADAERVVATVGEARATLVRSRSVGRAVLVTEAMPPAPNGSRYALWFASPDGAMVPAGTMPRRTDQTVLLEGDATTATAVGITVEPAGSGDEEPTSAPLVLLDLGA